jgi:phage terminase small subunit
MKSKKLTKKQEKFVDLMVYQDWNQTKCAHLAGYENPGVSATRLMSNPEYAHVQERMRSLKAVQRTKNEITYEGIAKKLGEIRDVALADGSYGPAVTAEIARAKLAGLMVDRKELKIHKIDNMSRDQLEVRLKQLVQEHQIVIGGEVEVVKDEMVEDVIEEDVEEQDDVEVEDVEDVEDVEEDTDVGEEEEDTEEETNLLEESDSSAQ